MADLPLENARVLLAETTSFCSSYLSQAIENAGAVVSGPFAQPDEVLSWLQSATDLPSLTVLSADVIEASRAMVTAQLQAMRIPYLVVQESLHSSGETPVAFAWPFAAFQVVEALQALTPGPAIEGEAVPKNEVER